MNTKILKMDEENIDADAIREAGNILRNGGLVAFPTETVYGLGGDALNAESSGKIYAAKGRPSDNPLIVHIAGMEELSKIVRKIPEEAYLLAEHFWPGPLTMIFEKSDCVPLETTGGLETVAVRMPSNKIARALIHASGGYIAAPSANLSGRPSPTVAKYVIEDLDGRVDMIIDGGEVNIGLESTIIDLTGDKPMILRPGYITEEMLEETIGSVEIDQTIIEGNSKQAPKAPGMKYRHYAPKGNLTIIEGEADRVVDYINEQLRIYRKNGSKTGVIATDETATKYQADSVKSAGKRKDEDQIAHQLFRILREFDDESVEIIYAESFEGRGVGQAIMNRLLKAAGHQVIKL
ncbi:MAG: L-threonylcarbamoyladenylate synthase [Firmicutes bacterium]|nr:L-threonylcarbamoyladenylate synthase [Bacillota bacterium]